MQKILGSMRRAITDYDMISEGDHIAVGISGGKDSLALLTALNTFKRFSPNRFTLSAITVDLGFDKTSKTELEAMSRFIENLGIDFYLIKTDIGKIIFEIRKERNPCSLCSKMRRGALNKKAIEIGANKLALGHHADDLVQTMMLSLLYEGRFSTFAPVSYLDRSGITLIRPFIYTSETEITELARHFNLPVVNNPCPANKHTQREYVNNLIKNIQQDVPFAGKNMLSAIYHPERNNLWEIPNSRK